jgi:hypothetical protein
MTAVFLVCAAVGGTILVFQFLLALIGLGGDAVGVELPHDLGHDASGLDHDFSAADGHMEMPHDGTGESHGTESHGTGQAHGSHGGAAWFFRALSLRTIVAALTFFGLSGLTAEAAHYPPTTTLLIALAAGLAALYAVYGMLCGLQSLRAEGTVRLQRAVGREATVYLRIPGGQKGMGKVQINLQNRTLELLATTAGEAIPTGAAVVVTKVLGSETVEVAAVTKKSDSAPPQEAGVAG